AAFWIATLALEGWAAVAAAGVAGLCFVALGCRMDPALLRLLGRFFPRRGRGA
ncbi:MAG: hypothetical protein RLY86_2231, partial [Pseudomonadota bacterium]